MEIVSAGGVVYRETRDGGEIVVCGRFDTKSHHLPKGTPEPGETREVVIPCDLCPLEQLIVCD